MSLTVNQSLDFEPSHLDKFMSGGKFTTIRLGYKDIRLGSVALTSNGLCFGSAFISEIRVTQFGQLGLIDAVHDGFNTIDELKEALQNCYQKFIHESEPVTIIRLTKVPV